MISGKKFLAIIPARSGSKRIIDKNIKIVGGKPLIAWSIDQANSSKYLDRTIISTDCEKIRDVAKKWQGDIPFLRPSFLAKDDTPGVDTVIHAIKKIKSFDYVVLLQPTSPLRTSLDIDKSIEFILKMRSDFLVSMTKISYNFEWMYKLVDNSKITKAFKNPNNLSKTYILNGAIYIGKINKLLKTKSFINNSTVGFKMPYERSLDIDTEDDLNKFKEIWNKKL